MAKTNPMSNLRIAARVYKLAQQMAESNPQVAVANLRAAIKTTEETLTVMKQELKDLEKKSP